jgi:hypothetical protein
VIPTSESFHGPAISQAQVNGAESSRYAMVRTGTIGTEEGGNGLSEWTLRAADNSGCISAGRSFRNCSNTCRHKAFKVCHATQRRLLLAWVLLSGSVSVVRSDRPRLGHRPERRSGSITRELGKPSNRRKLPFGTSLKPRRLPAQVVNDKGRYRQQPEMAVPGPCQALSFATDIPRRSFTASWSFCLLPMYRSVVCTEAWPSRN